MYKSDGYREFDGQRIYDEEVYQFIKKHSRIIDRINPRKMIEMSDLGYAYLMGCVEEFKDENWKFYGKHAPK